LRSNCEIACPGFKRWVAGYYDVDASGRYLVGENGAPVTERTFCFNQNNTCPHDSCVLHRGGKGTIVPKAVKLAPNSYEQVPLKRRGTGFLS
jgi:hypothetical protein